MADPLNGGEFKIGKLFKKLSTKYTGTGNKFDAVRRKPSKEFSLPVTYAKYNNNGIMYWGRQQDFESHANCISIIYNGAVSAGLVFAQKEKTGVLAESYLIDLKNYTNASFNIKLYMTTALKKAIYPFYLRDNLAVWSKVKNNNIKLPSTSDDQPDNVQNVTFTQHGIQDLVTKTIIWTPSEPQTFKQVNTPAIEGYTPDIVSINQVTVNFGNKDINKVVTYKANDQLAGIKY